MEELDELKIELQDEISLFEKQKRSILSEYRKKLEEKRVIEIKESIKKD